MSCRNLGILSACLIVFLLIVDQIIKIWVKTHFAIGQDVAVLGDWFHIHFIENEGMAFGISFGEQIGKLLLTVFRVVVVGGIVWYLVRHIRKGEPSVISVVTLSLVIAGAVGNIIDCLFYGLVFSESTVMTVATAFPEGGGYAPMLFGRVVDMFYFPLFPIPDFVPVFGGSYFFPAIFNFADSCVTVGVVLVIVFSKSVFGSLEPAKKDEA